MGIYVSFDERWNWIFIMNKRIKKKLAKKQPIIKVFTAKTGPEPIKVIRTKDRIAVIY